MTAPVCCGSECLPIEESVWECAICQGRITLLAECGIDPRLPTHHPPGSEGKIRVLTARAAQGLPLFVTGDNLQKVGRREHPAHDAQARQLPRGVSRFRGRYRARVWLDGAEVYLGLFGTVEEAEQAIEDAGG